MDRRLRLCFVLLSLLRWSTLGAVESSELFATVYAATESVIAGFFPRPEGSHAEAATFAFLEALLREYRIEYRSSDFREYEGGHSFSRSISVLIPGAKTDELIIAIPMNHRRAEPDDQEGTSRIALGAALAVSLSRLSLPISVRVLFLGAEFGPTDTYPMGTNDFLSSYYPDGQAVVVYLDIAWPAERVTLRAGDSGNVSPYRLVESCSKAMDAAGIYYLVRGNETQFYRLGFSPNPAPLRPYLESSIPGLSIHSGGRRLSGDEEADWARRMYEFVIGFTIDNDRGFDTVWDRHYLFFQIRSFSMIIPEAAYITTILAVLAVMTIYPLVAPGRFRNYAAAVGRYLWAVPALIVLVALLLGLGTAAVRAVSNIRGMPDLWMYEPGLVFALKLSTAVFLFALAFRYVKRLPFPRRGRFYNAVALFMLFADIVVLGLFDVSLAYYVVWALVFAFLFSLFSSRLLKTICLLASPVWFVKAAWDVFTLPELSVAHILILSEIEGNLIVALMLLPFLAMLIRLDFMFRHPRRRTRRFLMTATYLSLGLTFGTLAAYLMLFDPFPDEHPRPVEVSEQMDLDTGAATVTIESPVALRGVTIVAGGVPRELDTPFRSIELIAKSDPAIVTIAATSSRFLGRAKVTLEIDSVGSPDTVGVSIDSSDELVIYDANFPFSYDSFSRAIVHIGRNPPSPLLVEFTVPASQRGAVMVEVTYERSPTDVEVRGDHIAVTRRLEVTRSLELAAVSSMTR